MTIEQEVLNQKARVMARMKVDPEDKHSAFENELAVRHLIDAVSRQAVHDHLQHVVSVQKFVVPDGPVKLIRKPGLLFPEAKGKRRRTIASLMFKVIKLGREVTGMICDQEGNTLLDECIYLEDALDAFDEIYFNQENP